MDCQILKVMSSKGGKLDYLWARCLWLAGESKGCKNDCEGAGEGIKGE
jgi:hypothetical protein